MQTRYRPNASHKLYRVISSVICRQTWHDFQHTQKQTPVSHAVSAGMWELRKKVFLEILYSCQYLMCGISQQRDLTECLPDAWLLTALGCLMKCYESVVRDSLASDTDENCWGGLSNVTWHKLFDVFTDSILGTRRISETLVISNKQNTWSVTSTILYDKLCLRKLIKIRFRFCVRWCCKRGHNGHALCGFCSLNAEVTVSNPTLAMDTWFLGAFAVHVRKTTTGLVMSARLSVHIQENDLRWKKFCEITKLGFLLNCRHEKLPSTLSRP